MKAVPPQLESKWAGSTDDVAHDRIRAAKMFESLPDLLLIHSAVAAVPPPLQYNSAFYACSIGQIQRSIPPFDGADRCCDRRYDRRGDGFPSHSVLRSETARIGDDDWNNHRVILHSSTVFRSGMGPCFRSLWTQARAAHRTQRIRRGLLCLRVRECGLAVIRLPPRARPWRRDHGRASGVRGRHGTPRRSRALPRLAFGWDECGYDAGPS